MWSLLDQNCSGRLRTSFLVLFSITIYATKACQFEGLIASCHKEVSGIPLQISARINHCHSPLDISFLIKSPRHYLLGDRDEPLYWEYTYVTTNSEESKEIPGFPTRIYFSLQAEERIVGNATSRESVVSIEAYFKIDEPKQRNISLIRQNVTIYRFDDCFYVERDNHITKIAIGMSFSVIALIASGLLFYLFLRNRRLRRQLQDEERQDLVKNMTPQSKSKKRSKKSKRSSDKSAPQESIKYVVPNEGSKDETHELEIYVSKTNGLERVEFPSNEKSKKDAEGVENEAKS